MLGIDPTTYLPCMVYLPTFGCFLTVKFGTWYMYRYIYHTFTWMRWEYILCEFFAIFQPHQIVVISMDFGRDLFPGNELMLNKNQFEDCLTQGESLNHLVNHV